jgi:mannosyltransferase
MNAPSRVQKVAAPLLLLAVTLLGAALRFYAIGQKGLWLDEAFSVWLGGHRLPEMWSWIARIDQHPPLYYTLLNLWMRMGNDAETVRLLSAVVGTLTIPVIFLLGQRLAGLLTGLMAALILAVSPFHVRFAQEARMYALLALAAAAAMACLACLLRKTTAGAVHASPARPEQDELPLRRRWVWTGYVVFTAAAMLTHSTALLLPVAMNLFVLGLIWRRRNAPPAPSRTPVRSPGQGQSWEERPGAWQRQAWGSPRPAELEPPKLRSWLVAQAGVLLLWGVIWLPVFIGQASGVYREFWMPAPTWRTVMDALGNFLSAHLPRQQMPWLDAIWVVYGVLLAFAIVALRRRPAVLALLLTLFLTPLIGELLVSLRRPVFYDRTLIWATIPLYVLLGAGIATLRRWPYLLAALAILIAANGVSLREYYANFSKEGWKEAAAYVGQEAREGDLVLFNASWVQIPFDFYFRAAGKPVAEHGLPADLFDRGVLEPRMTPEDLPLLRELIRGRERVWLVYSHDWYTDPQRLIPAALEQVLTPAETRSYGGVEIRLYEGARGE